MCELIAPKDPEKRRPYFYIMRRKEIFGARQSCGKGVQFLYQDGGRLIGTAGFVGNVTDETILDLLKSAGGFRKLVHSIGVSVEMDSMEEEVEFIFQMNAKKFSGAAGTQLRCGMKGDGVEQRILLAEQVWSEADDVPGQIRFEFDTPEQLARVTVRLYLNDGYEAPPVPEEETIDNQSPDYRRMIEGSLMHLGNGERIRKAIRKARLGEEVTLAYIGGSITQGAGAAPINRGCYPYKSCKAFGDLFGTGDNVRLIKAGVGGTSSELGMLRFERDILRDGQVKPDVVVVEFAVNDGGDETKGVCYESLVRKILMLPGKPAVILLFAVFANNWNLQERLSPVGMNYDLPMVSIRNAVTPQFQLKKGEGRVIPKSRFFFDPLHPSNMGHTIMADCLTYLFTQADKPEEESDHEPEGLLERSPVIGDAFESVKLMDRRNHFEGVVVECGMFKDQDTQLQSVEMDENLYGTSEFPYNWHYSSGRKISGEKDCFAMKITCQTLLLIFKDSGSSEFGSADVFVDGSLNMTADPKRVGWTHCSSAILFQGERTETHKIEIRMKEGDEDKKFTILGFGYVE